MSIKIEYIKYAINNDNNEEYESDSDESIYYDFFTTENYWTVLTE